MTMDDVRRIFATKIVGDDVILPDGSKVEIETFANIFVEAPANPSYEDLMLIDNEEKGYKPFFDQCKVEGILVPLSE